MEHHKTCSTYDVMKSPNYKTVKDHLKKKVKTQSKNNNNEHEKTEKNNTKNKKTT